jgi:hypothetical protein
MRDVNTISNSEPGVAKLEVKQVDIRTVLSHAPTYH